MGAPGVARAERTAGLFLNTVPVRLRDRPTSWIDTVEQLTKFDRASHQYRRYPLQAMQSDAGREIVAVVFNFVNYHQLQTLTTSAELALVGFEALEQTNFALLVTVGSDPRSERMSLRVSADPGTLSAPDRSVNTPSRTCGSWRPWSVSPMRPSIPARWPTVTSRSGFFGAGCGHPGRGRTAR